MSKLSEELSAMGYRVTKDLALLGPVRCYIDYNIHHPHALGWHEYWVKVVFLNEDGTGKFKKLDGLRSGGSAKENRDAHFNAAVEYYNRRAGSEPVEWVRSPLALYGDWEWIPKPTYDHVMELVKARRKEQKAKAKASASESA